ncbi:MAG: hypothetical protein K5746_01955 [Clostridiales bacterium]|nr:hypothetical protein [Clostridiales bacterium]
MRKAMMTAALLLLLFCFASSAAEAIPDTDCFSPGTLKAGKMLSSGVPVQTDLSLSVSDALFIQDKKVLSAVLSGLSFRCITAEKGGEQETALSMLWKDESIASAAVLQDERGTALFLDGRWMRVEDPSPEPEIPASFSNLIGSFLRNRFSRISPEDLKEAFAGWNPGERFWGFLPDGQAEIAGVDGGDGISVSLPLKNEDGAWVLSLTCLRGSQTNPTDEIRIELIRDENTSFSLALSVQWKQTGKGDGSGTVTASLRGSLEGKRDGNPVDGSLTVTLKNTWSRKNGTLDEKITSAAKLSFRDRTPGRNYLNLGHDTIQLRETIRCQTPDGDALEEDAPIEWTDQINLTVDTDGGTLLSASAAFSVKPAEELLPFPESGNEAETVSLQELRQAMQKEARAMAARIYARMDDRTKKLVNKGL